LPEKSGNQTKQQQTKPNKQMSNKVKYNKRTKAYRAVAETEGMLPETDYPTSGSYSFHQMRDEARKVIGKIFDSRARKWTLEYDKPPYYCGDDSYEPWECTFTYRMDSIHWNKHEDQRPPIWLEGEVTVSAVTLVDLFDRIVEKLDSLESYERHLNESLILADHMAKIKSTETV